MPRQKRRTVSLNPLVYERLVALAEAVDMPVAAYVTMLIEDRDHAREWHSGGRRANREPISVDCIQTRRAAASMFGRD